MSHPFDHTMDDAWRHERFVVTIQQRAGIGWEKAERVARATLQTLSERITPGEVGDLTERLPEAPRCCAVAEGHPSALTSRSFLRRLARRPEVEEPDAERNGRPVFAARVGAVGPGGLRGMRAQLPKGFRHHRLVQGRRPAPQTPTSRSPVA